MTISQEKNNTHHTGYSQSKRS